MDVVTITIIENNEIVNITVSEILQIQSDWNQADNLQVDYIKNKPTELSAFTDDSTHRLVTDTEKSTWNGKANVGDSYTKAEDNSLLSGKVDKVTGSSLVADTEIAKIHAPGSDNQDLSNLVEKVTGSSLVPDTEIAKIHASGSDNETATSIATILTGVSADTITTNDELPFYKIVGTLLKKITYGNFLTLLNSIYTRGNLTAENTERLVTTAAGSGGATNNTIQTEVLFITDTSILTALLTSGNWTGSVYTGITTGVAEGQLYVGSAYLYVFSNGTFTRYLQA
ncbi:MAG: hypothetical protein ACYC2U_08305 [Candidatus Amoebophilus sp.]